MDAKKVRFFIYFTVWPNHRTSEAWRMPAGAPLWRCEWSGSAVRWWGRRIPSGSADAEKETEGADGKTAGSLETRTMLLPGGVARPSGRPSRVVWT